MKYRDAILLSLTPFFRLPSPSFFSPLPLSGARLLQRLFTASVRPTRRAFLPPKVSQSPDTSVCPADPSAAGAQRRPSDFSGLFCAGSLTRGKKPVSFSGFSWRGNNRRGMLERLWKPAGLLLLVAAIWRSNLGVSLNVTQDLGSGPPPSIQNHTLDAVQAGKRLLDQLPGIMNTTINFVNDTRSSKAPQSSLGVTLGGDGGGKGSRPAVAAPPHQPPPQAPVGGTAQESPITNHQTLRP